MSVKNILIADDDPSTLMLVSELVKRKGLHPITAKDGKEAHEILQTELIHLLIADQVMPFINGAELAWWMKTQENLQNIPVIIMSAEEGPKYFNKLVTDQTINDFIAKPLDASALNSLLEKYLP